MEAGVLTPVYGWIVDRYGTRGPTIAGAVIGAVGFVVLSRTDSLPMFYTGFFLAGLGLGVWWVTPLAAITNWFAARRTLAIAIAMTGWGLSGAVAPVLVSLIEHYGWRSTLLGIAAATLVLGVSLGSLLRYRPEDHGYAVDGVSANAGIGSGAGAEMREPPGLSAREALRTRVFWILAVVYFGALLPSAALYPHIVLYLGDVGIDTEIAAFAIATMSISSNLGRLGGGLLGDRLDKRLVLFAGLIGLGLGTFAFAFVRETWHLAILLLIGPSYGALGPLIPTLVGDLFGRRAFALLLGLCMLPSTIILFGVPSAAGWVSDSFGSYRPAWIAVALVTLAIAPLGLWVRRPHVARLEGAAK
jgi:MFS family permease